VNYRPKARMLFCDWHMPSILPEVKIDYEEYFAQIKRTGAECLIFQVKTAHGAAFAPTQVGFTNPTMSGDLFGEIVRGTKAAGLEFISYYNVILSWDLWRVHPEWSQIGRDGQPLRMFLYPCSCMSNDQFRAHVCAHMAEVTRNYPIDGWFLDLQYFSPQGCFCDACKAKFSTRFGYELEPDGFSVPQWHDLLTYQVDMREEFIHATQEACDAERPGLSWSWNGCGSPFSISDTLDEGAHYLSTEAHPPEYLHADHATRYCEALGKPFTLFMPESQGSWGDWTITTPETIKGLSAIALAQNGALNVNHVPYPCGDWGGKVPTVIWDTIKETFDFVAEREALCHSTSPVPVVGVLHSASNARLLQAMSRAGKGGYHGGATYSNEHAIAQLLMETHIPWEIRLDNLTLQDMQRYELLVLPCMPHVGEDLAQRLRAYVSSGGKLLANYRASLMGPAGEALDNFALADLLGVDFHQDSPYSISYLDRLAPLFGGVPEMPLVIKDTSSGEMNPQNHTLQCSLREGAEALAWLVDPIIESDFETGHFVYHDHAPPGFRTDYPGLVLNQYGDGLVAYFPVPFFGGYARKKCPFLKGLFRALVCDRLGVSSKVRITGPRSVKCSLREDDQGWLLHAIHIQKGTDDMYLDAFCRSEPVTVVLRPGWSVGGAHDCLTGEAFAIEAVDGWQQLTIPCVLDHRIVRLSRA